MVLRVGKTARSSHYFPNALASLGRLLVWGLSHSHGFPWARQSWCCNGGMETDGAAAGEGSMGKEALEITEC